MRRVTVIAALCCLAAQCAGAADDVASFVSDSCQQYRYDLARSNVSADELSEIMELVGPIYAVRTNWVCHLQLCIDGDPAYQPCGSRKPSSPHFLHNAGVNVARGQDLLNRMAGLRSSLAELKQYYAFRYGFWIELGTRKLDYLRLRDPALLRTPLMGLNIAEGCGSQANAMAAIEGDDDAVLAAFKGWHTCVNHLMHDSPTQSAGYPEDAWQAFLRAEGIREQITPLPDCEQES